MNQRKVKTAVSAVLTVKPSRLAKYNIEDKKATI